MTHSERISNLTALRYAPREAEFLALAARHSGYFTRQQFLDFLGVKHGYADNAFMRRIVQYRHARRLNLWSREGVYGIDSPMIFNAIGAPNLRPLNTDHDGITVKSRLMALDYVIANREFEWAATEAEKVRLFESYGLSRDIFPQYRHVGFHGCKTRYFTDRSPIGRRENTMRFVFLDPGCPALRFASFLRAYDHLLRHLPGFELVYIACQSGPFARAETDFTLAFAPHHEQRRLLSYFRNRKEAENTPDLAGWGIDRLNGFASAKRQFAGEQYDALYALWKVKGNAVFQSQIRSEPRLITEIAEHRYESILTVKTAHESKNPVQTAMADFMAVGV